MEMNERAKTETIIKHVRGGKAKSITERKISCGRIEKGNIVEQRKRNEKGRQQNSNKKASTRGVGRGGRGWGGGGSSSIDVCGSR